MESAIETLLVSYHELNPSSIDELTEAPSPLEFMRYAARNIPFVVRGGISQWPAFSWDLKYLEKAMDTTLVEVAITPTGNADAVVEGSETTSRFIATPLKTKEPFKTFLRYIAAQELGQVNGDVKYAQTQDDNLRKEYSELYGDVEKDIPWARIALGRRPEAINLWLGNSKSVTALHRDNYENVYCQIIGSKHFVLLPPIEAPCINEQFLPCATYKSHMSANSKDQLMLTPSRSGQRLPVATWDPDDPLTNTTPFSRLSKPLRFTLHAGDQLYLPALWYHKVSQSCSQEGICCSVNYWYDMDFAGSFYASNDFLRSISSLAARKISHGLNEVEQSEDGETASNQLQRQQCKSRVV